MTAKESYSYIYSLKWVLSQLPKRKGWQFFILLIFMIGTSLFETLTLGMIAFFASAVADPEAVLKSKYVSVIRQYNINENLLSADNLIVISGIVMLVFVVGKNILKGFSSYISAN